MPRKITVDGVRLSYLDVGSSSSTAKPPLLLLHGLLATAQTLNGLIRNLPQDRRIVALDILSAAPFAGELDTRAEALARLVGRFAQSIHLHKPVVVGHSHGGALALWLAAREDLLGSEIQGLVLLCPAHPFAGYRPHVVAFYLTRWGRFLALSIPLAPRWMILRAYNEAAGPGRPITKAHLKPYMRVLRSRRTLRRVLQMLHTWEADMSDLRHSLLTSVVKQPTLLIWGDQDVVVPLASAAELERCLSAGELTVLPGRGHLLAEEAPEECGRLVRSWLARVESEKPAPVASAGQLAGVSRNSSESQERIAAPRSGSFDSGD